MKVCILTSGHPLYDSRIFFKEVLSLRNRYDDITLIGPFQETGTIRGIKVLSIQGRRGRFNRFQNLNELYKRALEINADLYHVHEPDSLIVGYLLKKKLGCKLIYDSHEYHPEAFAEHFPLWSKRVIQTMVYWMERFLAKKADGIITVNDNLVNKFRAYHQRVFCIPNYPIVLESDKQEIRNPKGIIYVGGLTKERGILKILRALKGLDEDYQMTFVGRFNNSTFEQEVKDYVQTFSNPDRITFPGFIPHDQVKDYLLKNSIGLVLLQPGIKRYVESEPIKLFEYMENGLAVLASDFPMVKKIVMGEGVGLVVNPTDPEVIRSCLQKMLSESQKLKEYGKNGLLASKEKYNWHQLEKKLFALYEEIDREIV